MPIPRLFRRPNINAANFNGDTKLTEAAADGNVFRILWLLLCGAGTEIVETRSEYTPLMRAAYGGNAGAVRLLLAAGAEIRATDYSGRDSLMWAAHDGNVASTHALLNAGANPLGVDTQGITALMMAAHGFTLNQDHIGVAHLLLRHGADVNARSNFGQTALMAAACDGWDKMMQLLVDAGADPSERDKSGATLLMAAARGMKLRNIQLALKLGCDILAVDNNGHGVLEHAEDGYWESYGSPFGGLTQDDLETTRQMLIGAGAVERLVEDDE